MNTFNNNQDFDLNSNNGTGNEKKKPIKRIIKTYRDIAVESLDSNPTSLAKMIINEKKKREKKQKRSIENPKNKLMVAMSVVLAILGVLAIAGVVIFINTKNNNEVEKNTVTQLISSNSFDYKKVVEFENVDFEDLSNEVIKSSILPFGEIKNIFFSIKRNDGYRDQLTAKEFITALDTRAPNQLIRNLRNSFSVGIINFGENKPFMILETRNVDAAFLNLRNWEKQMLFDIGYLFGVNQKYYTYKFDDVSFFNHEARVILNDEAELVFGYAFIPGNKVIFFTDLRTFETILNREKIIEKQ